MVETCKKEEIKQGGRLPNGRFAPGVTGNPKGSNKYTTIVPLIEALKKAGIKRKEDFWDMVASRAWSNETVLNAILKKLLPDKIEGKGFSEGLKIIIVRDKTKIDENRSLPQTVSR